MYRSVRYRATPDFWYHYRQLPNEIQDLADRCYELLKEDSRYPLASLFKLQNPGLKKIEVTGTDRDSADIIFPGKFKGNFGLRSIADLVVD